ncbi:unnamed protein product [Calicophoron daubneyi]|uniref:Uncharacterized protein n=1 Tax=Calicophoron daubneyi TaxID=300641 RepID=A0AAV2TB86_CALDB
MRTQQTRYLSGFRRKNRSLSLGRGADKMSHIGGENNNDHGEKFSADPHHLHPTPSNRGLYVIHHPYCPYAQGFRPQGHANRYQYHICPSNGCLNLQRCVNQNPYPVYIPAVYRSPIGCVRDNTKSNSCPHDRKPALPSEPRYQRSCSLGDRRASPAFERRRSLQRTGADKTEWVRYTMDSYGSAGQKGRVKLGGCVVFKEQSQGVRLQQPTGDQEFRARRRIFG